MVKKNILIVSYSYPPSNTPAAQRPYMIAKFLDKAKYNVTVLTCGNADSSLGFDKTFNEELPDVNLLKVDALLGNASSSLREYKNVSQSAGMIKIVKSKVVKVISSMLVPDKAIFWLPKVMRFLRDNKEILDDLDVVFSTSPTFTNHLAAKYIVGKTDTAVWISDLRDFHFVENIEYNSGIKQYLNKRIEASVIKRSNHILFVSNAMRDVYATYYKKHALKMKVLYNGFDSDEFSGFEIKSLNNNKLSIFYAGSFYGGARSPLPLFKIIDEAFKRDIISKEEIEIVIAGNLEENLLENLSAFKSYHCLNYLGCIPRSEVLLKMTESTLLWLIVSKRLTHYMGVPIKLYEYMAARRPIISFAPKKSEATKIILENDLGWCIDEDKDVMENQILIFKTIVNKFRNGTLHKILPLHPDKKYDREAQTKKFETIIES